MNNAKFISASEIKKRFSISSNTLRGWAEDKKIEFIRPNNTRRLYNINDVNKFFGVNEKEVKERETICYARVSSSLQSGDLERQVEQLREKYPDATIIKDIGSGLNWKRKGFKDMVDRVFEGTVKEVVVTYNDRLCRFGSEFVEWVLQKHNTKLVVLNKSNEIETPTRELEEDLLSIVTVFVARNNGKRAAKYKKERNKKVDESENFSNTRTEK